MVLLGFAGAMLGAMVSTYWTVVSWRSSADEWRAINLGLRPKSWERWPIYSLLWRHLDSHTSIYLWQTRILAPLSLVFFLEAVPKSVLRYGVADASSGREG